MVIAILFARAVSDSGDLVTGELLIGKRGDASIRLMPVGFGYRYAAQGLLLDGWRGNSELHFGVKRPLTYITRVKLHLHA
jgi:hypothetical protein